MKVASDAAGNVYVGDSDNNRIQKFDSLGTWDRAWGKDVDSVALGTGFEICTVSANCKAGSLDTALGGELNLSIAVATDAAGDVYVADALNNRIQKFADPSVPPSAAAPSTVTGQRVAALKKCKKKHGRARRRKCKRKANRLPV